KRIQECRSAALLYRLRALQLQSEGKHRAALDHLNVLLGLSRHLRNKTITASFLLGLEVEAEALSGLDAWARAAHADTELLRDALKALEEHENELPPVDDVLKAHYFGAVPKLRAYFGGTSWTEPSVAERTHGRMFLLALETPWEGAR